MAGLEIPTPSPLPSPSDSPYSLSERINIATRPTHSQLNRLILVRLPLALPPYRKNPSTYISGLLHIAPIYMTFESLWQSILDSPRLPTALGQPHTCDMYLQQSSTFDACDPEHPLLDSKSIPFIPSKNLPPLVHTPKVCSRTHSLLSHLQLPGLLRAGRLRADIRILTGTPEDKIEEQLETVSQNGRLAAFIAHTKQSIETNPHVLLAYAWVLYMALFSGGRYLRALLQGASGLGSDFWNRDPSPVRPYSATKGRNERHPRSDLGDSTSRRASRSRTRSDSMTSKIIPGMQFFNFSGYEDGEDIKLEFKKRVTEAEVLLTNGEKEDIIAEAQVIFKFMVEIVGELDKVMGTSEDDIETASLQQKSRPLMEARDSVAVAQERLFKKSRTPSDELEKRRKTSYLDVLVTGPVTRLVHFGDAWRNFKKPLSSKDSDHSRVSFKTVVENESMILARIKVLTTIVPTLMVIVMFLVWCLFS